MTATDPDVLQAEIQATREQLGRTIDELTQRLDVPARARAGLQESLFLAKDTAVETYRESPVAAIGIAVAVVAGVLALVVWSRQR